MEQIKSKKKWLCANCNAGRPPAPIATDAPVPTTALVATAAAAATLVTAATATAAAAAAPPAAAATAPAATAAAAASPVTAATATAASPVRAAAPAAATTAEVPAAAVVLATLKAGWEAVDLVLCRGARGYGFTVNLQGLVEEVKPGMSGAVAGLEEGDVIVGVNDDRLRHNLLFAYHLTGRQCEGVKLKLTVHRRCRANDPNKRQRTAVRQQPGMQAFAGVRLGDGARTHAARLAATFANGTADSL
jgi:membrane-associated protease RseP (regulator of RpoE activity)